jgi:hypothetical protein
MKKKIIAIAMLATVAFSSFAVLAGCGGGTTPDPQPSTTTSSPAVASTTHTLHGKNFSIPSSWTKEVNGNNTIFRANLSEFLIITCDEANYGMDFSVANTYYSNFAQSFTSIDNTKCTAPEAVTIGNITWYHMSLVGSIQDMLGTYKLDSYVTVVDGVLWSISMAAYTTASTDYSQILKDVVDSISNQSADNNM